MANEQLLPWINSAGADGERNSMVSFPCDGNRTAFEFNFAGGYIDRANVKAYTYEEATGLTAPVALAPSNFLGPNTLSITPAIPAGFFLVVYRDTQKTVPLVNYATGAVMDEKNLDMSNQQAVFVAAEMVDRFDAINASSTDAVVRSVEAVRKADEALSASDKASTDAANALSASGQAVTTANAAKATADGIDAKATQAMTDGADAVQTANAAKQVADAASATANGIDGKAQRALDNSVGATNIATNAQTVAQVASATASDAKATANGIDAKAQLALDTTTTALTGATWIRGLQGGNNSKWVGAGKYATLFDLSFTNVTIARAAGSAPVSIPAARIRINLAGPVGAGGWDVADTPADADVYVYIIAKADGSGVTGIASRKSPSAGGPKMPSDFAVWCLAVVSVTSLGTPGFRFNCTISKDTVRYYNPPQFVNDSVPADGRVVTKQNYPLAGNVFVSEHFGIAKLYHRVLSKTGSVDGRRCVVNICQEASGDAWVATLDSVLVSWVPDVLADAYTVTPYAISGSGEFNYYTALVPNPSYNDAVIQAYAGGYKLFNNAI